MGHAGLIDRVKTLVTETIEVLVLCVLVALVANRLSPRGLRLDHDYFESSTSEVRVGSRSGVRPTDSPPPDSGDRWLESPPEAALEWFRDPRHRLGGVIFVDARKASLYQEGHIPGAYPLDRFYPEEELPAVILAGAAADPVVVYCNGGSCEDSRYAAAQLVEAGIDRSRIRVFTAGFQEWSARQWPVERGPRGSGLISNPLP
jgi:rhodanese-related sulfurtransferase